MSYRMTFRHIAIGALAGLAGVFSFVAVAARAQEPPRPDQLVDALNGVFGKHPGDRAAHTKGICLTGQFMPAPDAPSLSKARQFAKPVGITARFSLGGGNPQAPDNAQDNVRGLAVRFDLGNGANSDLVMISAPVFILREDARALCRFSANGGLGRQRQAQRLLPSPSRVDAAECLAHVAPGAGKLCRRKLLGCACLCLHQRCRRDEARQI